MRLSGYLCVALAPGSSSFIIFLTAEGHCKAAEPATVRAVGLNPRVRWRVRLPRLLYVIVIIADCSHGYLRVVLSRPLTGPIYFFRFSPMIDLDFVAETLASTRCRVFGIEDASNDAHRSVVAILAAGFDHPETTLLVEPTLARSTSRRVPDVVVIDPTAGLHVVEVKGHEIEAVTELHPGGKMRLDYGGRARPADPVAQSRQSMFDILNAMGDFSPEKPSLGCEHWAVFPRITRQAWQQKWGADLYEPSQLLFAEDLDPQHLADRMRAVGEARLLSGRDRHDADEMAILHRVFGDHQVLAPATVRPGRDLPDPNLLGARIDREAAKYRDLSDEQRRLSEADFSSGPRLVRGVAGSGKTVILANNLARRIAKADAASGSLFVEDAARPPRFLAVCFNRTLTHLLKARIDGAYSSRVGIGVISPETLMVRTFYGLMRALSDAGIVMFRRFTADRDEAAARARAYLTEIRHVQASEPDRLERFRFDGIYVDEAQDLEEDEIRVLTHLARPTPSGQPSLALFYDDAQNLYGKPKPRWSDLGLVMSGRSHVMTTCFRNTRQIVEPAFNVLNGSYAAVRSEGAAAAFTDLQTLRDRGAIEQSPDRKRIKVNFAPRHGARIKITRFDSWEAETDYLADRVERLITEQKVRPHDILILAYSRRVIQRLDDRLRRLDLPGYHGCRVAIEHMEQLVAVSGYFSICTVHSAKGYDANIVIVASAQEFRTDAQGRAVFYVACTRAQQYLEVTSVSQAPLIDELEKAVSDLAGEQA